MTAHDFDTLIDDDGPFMICRICGTTFRADTPAETVAASQCVGAVTLFVNGAETEFTVSSSFNSIILDVLSYETGFQADSTPEQRQLDKGWRLLMQWKKERGEK
jgi:hypothetical protein